METLLTPIPAVCRAAESSMSEKNINWGNKPTPNSLTLGMESSPQEIIKSHLDKDQAWTHQT